MNNTFPLWIVATQWAARAVLVLLAALSVWSVATMLRCYQQLRQAGSEDEFHRDFEKLTAWIGEGAGAAGPLRLKELQSWATESPTVHAGALRAAMNVPSHDPGQVDRAVRSYLTLRRTTLERGLTVLATLGSNAPFIGLFGTVLGIIQAFGALGAHQSNPTDIMAGISEALVATAIGLFVAIPAVVAFNAFSRRLKVILVNSESLRDLYLSRLGAKEAPYGG